MREEEEQRANPPLLERLAPLLPALRGWARANADGRLDHRKLLNDAVAEILTGPPPEAASLRAAIITAMQRQIDLAALKAELPRFTTEPRSAFRPDDKKSYLASEFTELHGRFDNLEHMLASRLPDRAQQQSPVAPRQLAGRSEIVQRALLVQGSSGRGAAGAGASRAVRERGGVGWNPLRPTAW